MSTNTNAYFYCIYTLKIRLQVKNSVLYTGLYSRVYIAQNSHSCTQITIYLIYK